MALHIDYCKGFGVSKEQIDATEESEGKRESLSSFRIILNAA